MRLSTQLYDQEQPLVNARGQGAAAEHRQGHRRRNAAEQLSRRSYSKEYAGHVKTLRKDGFTDEQLVAYILAYYVRLSRDNLFGKLSYLPIDLLKDFIPDATDESQLEYTKFFLKSSLAKIEKYIQEHKKSGTHGKTTAEMLKLRGCNPAWPY